MRFSKSSLFILRTALVGAAIAVMSACSIPIGPAKPLHLYEGAPRDPSQVAKIVLHATKANPSNMIEKLWGAGTMAIDGKDTEGYTVAYVPPGKHTFKMYCWNRDTKIKKNEQLVELTVAAGRTYHPWSTTNVTAMRGSGAPGAIAGTTVGSVAAGYCTPVFGNKDPDL